MKTTPKPTATRTRNKPRLVNLDDHADRGRAAAYIGRASGWHWVLVEPAKRVRTLSQNRFYFGCVVPAVRVAINETQGLSMDDMDAHELCRLEFLPVRRITICGRTKVISGTTRKLSAEQFSEYVDKCSLLAETLGGRPVDDPRKKY